jgi:hypothetical protein
MAVETHRLEDDGGIPNSPLPVLVYHETEDARCDTKADSVERPRLAAIDLDQVATSMSAGSLNRPPHAGLARGSRLPAASDPPGS